MTETAAPALQRAGDYVIDPDHSRIGFTARQRQVGLEFDVSAIKQA